jgi:hypothetical protein
VAEDPKDQDTPGDQVEPDRIAQLTGEALVDVLQDSRLSGIRIGRLHVRSDVRDVEL